MKEQLIYSILGLAAADAAGVPYEFLSRERIAMHPAADMTGFGSHHQPKGTWSDDTSMTLALIDALTKSGKNIDYSRIADNFADWVERGAFTAHGDVFDIGRTCLKAIRRHLQYPGLPAWECGEKSEHACGNGGLMRILPLAFWLSARYGQAFIDEPQARDDIFRVTAITHGNACCALAGLIYVAFAGNLLDQADKENAWTDTLRKVGAILAETPRLKSAEHAFARLFSENFLQTPVEELSGSGYVIHTLESAVWCFMNTADYRDCVLTAINLGEDTDTTAAVAGGLAGLYYGDSCLGIPESWLDALAKRQEIVGLCGSFYRKMCRLSGEQEETTSEDGRNV